jgi:hypothetical protein
VAFDGLEIKRLRIGARFPRECRPAGRSRFASRHAPALGQSPLRQFGGGGSILMRALASIALLLVVFGTS